MKTLVNKANPGFRITAPEIIEEEEYYTLDGETVFLKEYWTLVVEEPTCKESLQVEEEHPDNFTSFEWLVGRLMFRGCDLWGMTDGEDDHGVVTKLIKDRTAEMMELLERELDTNAEPVDLEKEIKNKRRTMLLDVFGLMNGEQGLAVRKFARHFYELGLKRKEE